MQAEQSKHHSNAVKCRELGWVYIPLMVGHLDVGDQKLNVASLDLLDGWPLG